MTVTKRCGVFSNCTDLHSRKEFVGYFVTPSFPLHLLPHQSNACTAYATWSIQQPSQTSFDFGPGTAVAWRNWLEEKEEVVLTVLSQAAEAAYSVQAFDWSGSRCRGKKYLTNSILAYTELQCHSSHSKPVCANLAGVPRRRQLRGRGGQQQRTLRLRWRRRRRTRHGRRRQRRRRPRRDNAAATTAETLSRDQAAFPYFPLSGQDNKSHQLDMIGLE